MTEHLVTVTHPTVQDPRSDLTLLCDALGRQRIHYTSAGPRRTGGTQPRRITRSRKDLCADHTVLQRLPSLLREENWTLRASLRRAEIIDVRPVAQRPLGLAVDIGTTKVAAYLVDMETGATLAVDGITNPQIAYGEDVMSRIAFTMKDDASRLTAVLLDGLNDLVALAVPRPGADSGRSGGGQHRDAPSLPGAASATGRARAVQRRGQRAGGRQGA